MGINAPDKGRDLSVDRVVADALGGTKRLPVVIQCKHSRSRSVDLGRLHEITRAGETLARCEIQSDHHRDVRKLYTAGG